MIYIFFNICCSTRIALDRELTPISRYNAVE